MHIKIKFFKPNETTATTVGKSHFLPYRMLCTLHFQLYFLLLHLMAAAYLAYLDQRHLRAESEQDFLSFGRVGVVSMLVEPLLQRPRHVLQSLTLVSHFTPAGTTPIGRKNIIRKAHQKENKKECEKVLHFCIRRLFQSFNCCTQICSRTHVNNIIIPGWHGSKRWI